MSESNNNLPATIDPNDPYAAYGREASRGLKPFLAFKKGFWTVGRDNTDVKMGTRVIALLEELQVGFVKWWDSRPVAERMIVLASRQPRPKREDLGDFETSLWQADDNGVKRDPWQETNTFPVFEPEAQQQWQFSVGGSRGGINAVADLCVEYAKLRRQHPGQCPVIELGSDSYQHSNKAFGRIHVPVFTIAGWVDNPVVTTSKEPDLLSHATGSLEEVAASTTKSAPRF